jgi:hypothetical protein
MTLGTVDYMAPEQQEAAAGVTIAADLYGLGCVLFHLLAGQPPFAHHKGVTGKLVAHRLEAPPDLRALRPGLPEELVRIVERLLAKRPQDRFAEPRQVAEALAPLAAGADLRAVLNPQRPVPAPAKEPPTTRPRPQRRRALVALLTLSLAVAVLCAVLAPWRSRPAATTRTAPAAPLGVRSLRVQHFAVQGETARPRGQIGQESFATRFGDQVGVTVELTEPAYCYLLALNPDGTEQLCWPGDEQLPPERLERLEYPARGRAFNLDDEPRGGLQAFVLIASREPLSPYAVWRARQAGLTWARLPATEDVVWRGDGDQVDPSTPGVGQRGSVGDLKGVGPLAEWARQVRGADGVGALKWVAFPVKPKGAP